MKQIKLLALLIICFAGVAKAQVSQPVEFTVKKRLGCYVVAICRNNPAIVQAVAKASRNVSSLDSSITVIVTESNVVEIYSNLTVLPEGVAAEHNKTLQTVLLPVLLQRDTLAQKIGGISFQNSVSTSSLETIGEQIINAVNEAYDRNDN